MNIIKKHNYILYSILIVIIFFILCIKISYVENSNKHFNENWKLYINNTLIEDNFNIKEDKFDTLKKGDIITITREMPQINIANPAMQIYSNYTTIEVFLDDKLTYEYGVNEYQNHIMLNNGNKFFDINYNNEKNITIKMIATESNIISNLNDIEIGSRNELLGNFIKINLFKIIVSGFTIFLSISMLLIFIKFNIINSETKKLFFISLYSLLIGTWLITDSGLLILFVKDTINIKIVEYLCLYCAPLPVYGFILNIKNSENKNIINKYVLRTIIALNAVFNIVTFSLFITNKVHIKQTLPLFQIILITSTSTLVLFLIKNLKKSTIPYKNILYGIILMILAVIADVIIFNMKNAGFKFTTILSNNLVAIGVLVLLIAMIYSFYKEMLVTIKKSSQMEIYNNLAYTDGLTQLKNRAWYENYVKSLKNKNYTMISLDLNDLKVTNDTKGHDKGDELITTFANILKETFNIDAHSIRFGGDEFLVILEYVNEEKMTKAINEMNSKIKEANKYTDVNVSASYGIAISTENIKLQPSEIYKIADQRMYKMKKSQKK